MTTEREANSERRRGDARTGVAETDIAVPTAAIEDDDEALTGVDGDDDDARVVAFGREEVNVSAVAVIGTVGTASADLAPSVAASCSNCSSIACNSAEIEATSASSE